MFSLSDITRQDDAIKLFKPWWEVLKDYLLYAMLFLTVVINGFKLSQEKFICMPATEGNDTCHYRDNASTSSCIIVEEIKSAAFSEYISLACAHQMDLFTKYFDLILLIFPMFIYVLGAVFYNIPLILYKFKDIHNIILHSNDDDVKALVTKLDVYIGNEISKRRTGKYNEDIDTLNKALDLRSVIQSILKHGRYLETNVLRVGPQGVDYHNVPTEMESNTLSFWEEEVRDISVPRRSRWFRFVYIIYTFLQFVIFVAYIITIALSWKVMDHESTCVLKETYRYKNDFFLCRHSLRRIYQHLSFLLVFLSVCFLFLILTQAYLLINGYCTQIKKHLDSTVLDITGDQRFMMTFVYFCKKWYLRNFCRLFNKDFYRKMNCYIADCKYPFKDLTNYVHTHKNSLRLENITALPFCITSVKGIILLEIFNSDLSLEGTLSPLKDLRELRQLVLNSCKIQIFDVGTLPGKIIHLDILSNPLKEVVGRCPESLNLCSFDKNGCSVKWDNFENVVILNENVIKRYAPVNWGRIYSYLKLYGMERVTNHPGEIHIFNDKVTVNGDGKIANVKKTSGNTCDFESYGDMKNMVFLKGVFSLLNFDVHLHGADAILESTEQRRNPRVIIFVFMGDVENNDINIPNMGYIKIVDLITRFARLDPISPTVSISLMKDSAHEFSTLELHTSAWNILYASVPQFTFQDNLIKYLNSEHEDDLASTISGWKDSKILNFLYKEFYLLPGFPWLDTDLSDWTFQCKEEDARLERLIFTVDRRHLSATKEDVVTSMADINSIKALQKSVGRIKLADRQVTCCMMSNNCVLVPAREFREHEVSKTKSLCAEFTTGKNMKTFYLEKYFSACDYDLGIAFINLKKGQNNIPEPVVLDSSPICGQAFVLGYLEELDSDLILESHCQSSLPLIPDGASTDSVIKLTIKGYWEHGSCGTDLPKKCKYQAYAE